MSTKLSSKMFWGFSVVVILLVVINPSLHTQIRHIRQSSPAPPIRNVKTEKNNVSSPIRSLCNYNGANSSSMFVGQFYRLPTTVTPIKYRLRFRIDSRRQKLHGHSLISIKIHNQTNIVELNSVKLAINGAYFQTRSIRVDANMVYNCPEKETVVLHFSKFLHKGNGNLTITFSGNLTEMVESRFIKTQKDLKLVMTDFGPIDARRKFPCWDEPKFRAQFDLNLIVPKNNFAISNLPQIRRRPYSTEYDEVRFETTPPLSTFQLVTIFGPRFVKASSTINSTFSNVTFQIFSPSSHNNEEWFYALESSEKLFNFYQYYFGQKYPIKKLDLVALRNYEQTSIEKLGLIILEEQQLVIANKSEASEEQLKSVAETLAHSLAHQWIGNMVTFKQWNEFWLFEALATFTEKEALDILFPHWRTWEQFSGEELRRGLESDASTYSIPLENLIANPNDVLQLYPNENSYFKAISLLRMLRSSIGVENGIRHFVKNFANNTASAEDLWKAFNSAISKIPEEDDRLFQLEIVKCISKWTKMAGFPILFIEEKQEGDNRIIKIRQERFLGSTYNRSKKLSFSNKHDVWPVPVSVVNSFNPFSPTHQAIITEQEMELSINDIWEGEWVKLNPQYFNFYRIRYSDDMLEKFKVSIEEKLLSPMDRLNLVDDLFALIRSGHISTDFGFEFLWSYENEDNPNVWSVIISAMNDIDVLISGIDSKNNTLRQKYRKFGQELLSKMYNKLDWYPQTELPVGQKMRVEYFAQSRLRENILCMMGQLRESNFTETAAKKFRDYINGESDLSIGLLECVFGSFSGFPQSPNQTTFEQLFNFYKDYDIPEARHLFSFALGSTENSTEIQNVIDFSLEPKVRAEDSQIMLKQLCKRSIGGRRQVISVIQSKFFNFVRKFGNFNSVYNFLKDVIETFSNVSQVSSLESKLLSSNGLKILNQGLRHSFEKVNTFEKWIQRDQKLIEQFLEKAPNTIKNFDEENEIDADIGEKHFFNFDEFDKK